MDAFLGNLGVPLLRGGHTPISGLCHSPPIPEPPNLTKSAHGSSRNHHNVSVPMLSSTAWECQRTSPKLGRDVQTATEQPSEAATPLTNLHHHHPHLKPFEAIFANFFDQRGYHYLVMGDCLSGWVEVLSLAAGTSLVSSAILVQNLPSFFATFGVPKEISSNG